MQPQGGVGPEKCSFPNGLRDSETKQPYTETGGGIIRQSVTWLGELVISFGQAPTTRRRRGSNRLKQRESTGRGEMRQMCESVTCEDWSYVWLYHGQSNGNTKRSTRPAGQSGVAMAKPTTKRSEKKRNKW